MKLILTTMVMIVVLGCVASAQTTAQTANRPNFSGTWELIDGSTPGLKDRVLVISQTGDEITIADSYEFRNKKIDNNLKLFADKRGEVNLVRIADDDQTTEVRSETAWVKNKLVRKSTFKSTMTFQGEKIQATGYETHTFRLSDDGNKLNVSISGRRQFSPISMLGPLNVNSHGSYVYRRKN